MEEVGVVRTQQEEEEDSLPQSQINVMAGSHHQGGVEGGREEVLAGQWEVEEGEVSNLTSSQFAVDYEEGRGRNGRAMAATSPSCRWQALTTKKG